MSASGCSIDTIPSSIYTYELSNINRRRLHIYANILGNDNKNYQCFIVAENNIVEFEVTTPPDVKGKIFCAFYGFVAENSMP